MLVVLRCSPGGRFPSLYIKPACGRVRACKQARPSDQAGNHRQTFSSCRLHHRNTTGLHRITQEHPSNLVHNYGLQRIPQENQGIPRVSYIISHYFGHYNQRTSVYFFQKLVAGTKIVHKDFTFGVRGTFFVPLIFLSPILSVLSGILQVSL